MFIPGTSVLGTIFEFCYYSTSRKACLGKSSRTWDPEGDSARLGEGRSVVVRIKVKRKEQLSQN